MSPSSPCPSTSPCSSPLQRGRRKGTANLLLGVAAGSYAGPPGSGTRSASLHWKQTVETILWKNAPVRLLGAAVGGYLLHAVYRSIDEQSIGLCNSLPGLVKLLCLQLILDDNVLADRVCHTSRTRQDKSPGAIHCRTLYYCDPTSSSRCSGEQWYAICKAT